MKFLVDECCPPYIVEGLRQRNHDVVYVAEDAPSLKDSDILKRGLLEERIIVTEDHDFGELIFRNQQPAFGVVLIRISHSLPREDRATRVQIAIENNLENLIGAAITITETNVRLRPLPPISE